MSRGRTVWTLVVLTTAVVSALTLAGPFDSATWVRPELLFSLTTVAAAACVVAATAVVALADRRNIAEIGLLGGALMGASVLPLVHGLLTPGVLFDANEAFRATTFIALPVTVAVASPLLVRSSSFGRWAARHWRDWVLLALTGVFVLGSIMVFFPDAIRVPGPHHPVTIVMSVGMAAAMLALSLRQLGLYELGRRPSNLVASMSIVLLATTAVLPVVETPYTAAFWWLHAAGVLGVIGACIGMAVTNLLSKSAQDILAPVLAREPLVAFELGLSPVVHQFVADLELKDQITRDHVVRTGELALRVGERMGLRGRELRRLGLAGMLHDVGKLYTPDEILKKPASLTADEYEIIKAHPVDGERMLLAEPSLAEAAPIVRSHHERVDGGGYPDGLAGDAIPLPSRIIAVCDAVDAMTHDRQYRKAMPMQMAFAILHEHAGSQWDARVVEQVMLAIPTLPSVSRFDGVGRTDDVSLDKVRIPDNIEALLETVDAEI